MRKAYDFCSCNKNMFFAVIATAVVVSLIFLFDIEYFYDDIFNIGKKDIFFSLLIFFMCAIAYFFISKKYEETKHGMKVIFGIFLISGIGIYFIASKFDEFNNYQTVISLYVSSLLVCAGWWIQSTVSRSASRKTHTLNLIVNQRFSEHFNNKNNDAFDAFGLSDTIHYDWVKYVFEPDSEDKDRSKNAKYIAGVKGLSYLLNFYEFVSVGIIQKDLDNKIIKECFIGVIPRLEKRGLFLIRYSQRKEPKAYENLIALIECWGRKSLSNEFSTIEKDEELIDNEKFKKEVKLSTGTKEKD